MKGVFYDQKSIFNTWHLAFVCKFEEHSKWKITGTFSSGKDCLRALDSTEKSNWPEIMIIDIQLMNETGFSLLQEITKNYNQIKCIMYSMYDTAGYILQAKDYGAKGYISKVASEQERIVFEKMLQGKTNEQIKDELCISLHSVQNYATYIYTLAEVHNRTEFIEKFGK